MAGAKAVALVKIPADAGCYFVDGEGKMKTRMAAIEETMTISSAISAEALGHRIRQLRKRRSQTQQDLAGEYYSKSYISAIEQGKARPSLQALQRIASRLGVQASTLLDADAPDFGPSDPQLAPQPGRRKRGARVGSGSAGLPEAEHAALNLMGAEVLLQTDRVVEALDILRSSIPADFLLQEDHASTALLDPAHFHKACYLTATVLLRLHKPQEALPYARKGLELGHYLGDAEGVERLRNLVGEAYFQMEEPLSALEHHWLCVEAVRNNIVRDPDLKLRIYKNIAEDYRALQQGDKALAIYAVATDLLAELNTPERHAQTLWEVAVAYEKAGNFKSAGEAANRALGMLGALHSMHLVIDMHYAYGEMLLVNSDLDIAAKHLQDAYSLAERLGSNTDKAVALAQLGRLDLQRGNIEAAGEQVSSALKLIRGDWDEHRNNNNENPQQGNSGQVRDAAVRQAGETFSSPARSTASDRVLASILLLEGEIAARCGDNPRADAAFAEAVMLVDASGNSQERTNVYQRYAHILMERGQHKKAAEYYDRAFRAAHRNTALPMEP